MNPCCQSILLKARHALLLKLRRLRIFLVLRDAHVCISRRLEDWWRAELYLKFISQRQQTWSPQLLISLANRRLRKLPFLPHKRVCSHDCSGTQNGRIFDFKSIWTASGTEKQSWHRVVTGFDTVKTWIKKFDWCKIWDYIPYWNKSKNKIVIIIIITTTTTTTVLVIQKWWNKDWMIDYCCERAATLIVTVSLWPSIPLHISICGGRVMDDNLVPSAIRASRQWRTWPYSYM